MLKALFIGTRFEACKAFYDIMHNYGYQASIITFKKSLIDKKRSQFNDSVSMQVLPYKKESTLNVIYNLLKFGGYKLLLSAGFPYILPKKYFSINTLFINSHPHLLPRYKGFKVIGESYKSGETNYGVTTHYMSEEVDSGEIIHTSRIYFIPSDAHNLENLYQALFSFIEPAAILETISILKDKGEL
ncbi:MAG: formyltransferase family protein [bacterium]